MITVYGLTDEKGDAMSTRTSALLTPRERQIVDLIWSGHTNKEMARDLLLSIKTIEAHRGNAMRKMGVHKVSQLLKYALRHDLVRTP